MIKTPISFLGWFLTSLLFTLICIPFTFLPERYRYENRLYFIITTLWGKILMFFAFIPVRIHGKANIPSPSATPSILVANHTSALDIFFIESIMNGHPHMWLTKIMYTKIPLFSVLLKRMHIPVERYEATEAAGAFLKAYRQAKKYKSHLILFPEGKRFDDGRIHDLHAGFAFLAKKLNRQVVPIALSGFHKIMPKGKLLLDYKNTKPTVTIGEPISIEPNESIEAFTFRIKAWFEEKLAK